MKRFQISRPHISTVSSAPETYNTTVTRHWTDICFSLGGCEVSRENTHHGPIGTTHKHYTAFPSSFLSMDLTALICMKCKQPGHFARTCTSKPVVSNHNHLNTLLGNSDSDDCISNSPNEQSMRIKKFEQKLLQKIKRQNLFQLNISWCPRLFHSVTKHHYTAPKVQSMVQTSNGIACVNIGTLW